MEVLRAEAPLPRLVDELLDKICLDQSQPPPDVEVRRRLALRGEEGAVEILHKVAATKIKKSLSGLIIYFLEHSSPPSTPSKRPRLSDSPITSGPRFPDHAVTVRYFAPPQGATEAVSRSLFEGVPRESKKAVMEALGELEFRKQFLILNYIGSDEIQTLLRTEEIRSFKDLPMVEFEMELWGRFGGRYVDSQDRIVYNDWDRGRTHLYHCHVSTEGLFKFKGPYLDKTKTHLQRVLGDDNVLLVKFAEEMTGNSCVESRLPYFAGYSRIAREGIPVGLRRYYFFVFKDGGKEDGVKCFFIRIHSNASVDQNVPYILSNRTISTARHLFMHAHTVPTVAKYMARFSLILSKTLRLNINDLSSVKMVIADDIYCTNEHRDPIYKDGKLLIHTDGTGYISEDLALLCPKDVHEGICIKDKKIEIIYNHDELGNTVEDKERIGIETREPPMLIQCRLFNNGCAVKGTFLVNKKLGPKTIVVRRSMVKVEPDPDLLNSPTQNSLEVVATSNRPRRTYLSRYLVALLSYGGVPDEYFQFLLREALREVDGAFRNKRTALKVALGRGNTDKDFTIAKMILCGIPLEEPYLQHRLSLLLKERKMSLGGGKLYVPDSYYLMGTADPTGKLRSNEVCIVLENGQVSGPVLVYRHPGIHFGDVHVLKATYVKELESVVGNAKYAIFFSTKGPRSIADEIAGGDYDGDTYWISRNSELLKYFKPSEPWISKSSTSNPHKSKRPDELSDEELEAKLFNLFLTTKFQPSFAMGEAADSWLALMDRFLTLGDDSVNEKKLVKEKIIKLIDIYYEALDAAKTGAEIEVPRELRAKSFPHYMEKKNSFTSVSILGRIYDEVNKYLGEEQSNKEIWKLPLLDVEVPQDCLNKWHEHYEEYKKKMTSSMNIEERGLKNEATSDLKRYYRKLLYGAEQFEKSTNDIEDIYNEALAIYHVCYDYAKSEGKSSLCSFAWSIAGPALCKLYASKKVGEEAFTCLPSVLREVL